MAEKSWFRMTIRVKLFILLLSIGILPVLFMGIAAIIRSGWALEDAFTQQLKSIRALKKNQIEAYFSSINNHVITFSESCMIVDAMKEFTEGFALLEENVCPEFQENRETLLQNLRDYYQRQKEITPDAPDDAASLWFPKDEVTQCLQSLYIASNPYPANEKYKLDSADDSSLYSKYHKKYHPIFRNFAQKFDFFDVFLIEPINGLVVYSMSKELDFASNVITGPHRNTNLARAYQLARTSEDPNAAVLVDFERYAPSYNAPCAFIASPIYNAGQFLGVLAFQISINKINEIMTDQGHWTDIGLGRTGQSFLVASDYSMRNDSRFLIENREAFIADLRKLKEAKDTIDNIQKTNTTILFLTIKTDGTKAAIAGEEDTAIYNDFRGVPVIAAYSPLDIPGLKWSILAEMDRNEANGVSRRFAIGLTINILIVLLLIFLVGMPIILAIARSICTLAAKMEELAEGDADLTKRLPVKRNDETGKLSRTFNQMMDGLAELILQVQKSGIQVTTSTTQIAASARQLEATVNEQASSTNEVVATAKEISATSQELANTMSEISETTSGAASLADEGRNGLQGMDATMRQLAESTNSISSKLTTINEKANNISAIVTTITKVADQTNLLSLNAAIEAEKAGEYGQGFSVVAREIRRLADQTAVSTLDIDQMVNEMQSAVSSGVMEMDKFKTEVGEGVRKAQQIASQLEQIIQQVQTITPQFLAVEEGMHSQSQGAHQITKAMVQLSEAAGQTAASLREFNNATAQLTDAAHNMQAQVSRFKVSD